MRKPSPDMRGTPCCGARHVKIAGLVRCEKCGTEITGAAKLGTGHAWDRHDREYDLENPKDRSRGRRDRELI